MSLAIGSWLFDGASEYSKSNAGLNEAMLAAMTKKQRSYNDTPEQALVPTSVYSSSPNSVGLGNNVKQDLKNTKNRSNILSDFMWVIK